MPTFGKIGVSHRPKNNKPVEMWAHVVIEFAPQKTQ